LFRVASEKSEWKVAYCAAVLAVSRPPAAASN
jgi:hypothetical protein